VKPYDHHFAGLGGLSRTRPAQLPSRRSTFELFAAIESVRLPSIIDLYYQARTELAARVLLSTASISPGRMKFAVEI
jgi:hypothetical protein